MTKTQVSTTSAGVDNARRRRTLATLAALGAIAAMWSLFLWTELVASRSGSQPFCAFGEEGCAQLWDGDFAAAVHAATGLPIAAWGMVWGLVAFVLPLTALAWPPEGRRTAQLESAAMVLAAAGVLGVVVMLAASAAAGLFCSSCAVTYVVTAAYAAVALPRLLPARGRPGIPGLVAAAAATGVAYLGLLYPGLHTPRGLERAGEEALAAVAAAAPVATAAPGAPAAPGPVGGAAPAAPPVAAPMPGADALLSNLLANLDPASLQALSDSLHIYRSSEQVAAETPRTLRGPAAAPVRISEFSDVLCSHCAALQETLDYLDDVLPDDRFNVDSRNFPLDGNCNPHLQVRGPESVRCVGARARICLDRTPSGEDFTKALFARQSELTPELVREIAAPYMPRTDFERCLASRETAAQLTADLNYAWRFQPDGTPLVLVNGRRGTGFGPFLYALAITGGDPDHAAFATLPPPNPVAHSH